MRSVLASTFAVVLVPFVHAQSNSGTPTGVSADDWSSIRAAYEAGRHAIVATDDGHRTRTPGQAWTTEFDARAFTTSPDGGGWSWGLELTHFGAANALAATGEPLGTTTYGQRLERRWSESLTEWYVNDTRGLEHGFTVHAPLAPELDASDVLTFELAVRGDLTPRISTSGRDVAFLADTGHLVLNYAGLVAFDADGDHLDAHFESRGSSLRLVVDARGANYPLTIDPIAQQAYIKASNTDAHDSFGWSVAIHEGTLVVGAPDEDSASAGVDGDQLDNSGIRTGAVYVFVRGTTGWVQQAYLKSPHPGANDVFGTRVAIFGDTVVVGTLDDSAAVGINGDSADDSAPNAGGVFVFVRNGTTWTQQAYLKASNTDAGDTFGSAIAISGETIVVGAQNEDGSSRGAAYVFVRNGGVWTQQAYLKASNAGVDDRFGTDVDIDRDTIVVSAVHEDSAATGVDGDQSNNAAIQSGAAYVFVRNGSSWSQQAYLKASNTGAEDRFGFAVGVWGDTVVVTAPEEDSSGTGVNGDGANNGASASGAAYVFARIGSTWAPQAYLKASNAQANDGFGGSASIWGNAIVVGARGEASNATGLNGDQSNNALILSGAAYVFVRVDSSWIQHAYIKASNSHGGDQFARSVAIDAADLIVGAPEEDSDAIGVGGDQSGYQASGSGAAYAFDLDFAGTHGGCSANPARFVSTYVHATIGSSSSVELSSAQIPFGVAATYYGALGVDANGCGILLSPTDEMLLALAPFPTLLALTPVVNGSTSVPVSVPDVPSLVGALVALQAVLVDTSTFASELSNAIEFEIRP